MSLIENKTFDYNYMGHNLIKNGKFSYSCTKCNSCIMSWIYETNKIMMLMEDPECITYYLEFNLSCNEVIIKNIIE